MSNYATQVFRTTDILTTIASFHIFDHDASPDYGQAAYRFLRLYSGLTAQTRQKIMGDRRKYTPEQFVLHIEKRTRYVDKELRKLQKVGHAGESVPKFIEVDATSISKTIEDWLEFNLGSLNSSTDDRTRSQLMDLLRITVELKRLINDSLHWLHPLRSHLIRSLARSEATLHDLPKVIEENRMRAQAEKSLQEIKDMAARITKLADDKLTEAAGRKVLDKHLKQTLEGIKSSVTVIMGFFGDDRFKTLKPRDKLLYIGSSRNNLQPYLSQIMRIYADHPLSSSAAAAANPPQQGVFMGWDPNGGGLGAHNAWLVGAGVAVIGHPAFGIGFGVLLPDDQEEDPNDEMN